MIARGDSVAVPSLVLVQVRIMLDTDCIALIA